MATADFSRIATNIGALNALQSLNNINAKLGVHQNRLATGKRINSAADDPAGLTIATKLNARSEGLKVAGDNIADAKNLLSVAESGLGRINDILTQMRNKAEQAASDTLGSEERGAIVTQLNAYAAQINDIVDQTTWNGKKLLNGLADFGGTLTFQTGADQGDTTKLSSGQLTDVSATNLGIANKTAGGAITVAAGVASGAMTNGAFTSTGVAGTNSNLSTINSGTYTVEVTYGADSAASATIKLFDAGGNQVMIDADGAAGGAINTSMTLTTATAGGFFGAADRTVDLGNGLSVTLDSADFSAAGQGTISATLDSTSDTFQVKIAAGELNGSSTAAHFSTFMTDLTADMSTVSNSLSEVGALMGRLSFKEEQVAVAQVNVEASYNRIMNANMAYEQVEATKYSILQQTSTTMLAQANMAPQGILGLFR